MPVNPWSDIQKGLLQAQAQQSRVRQQSVNYYDHIGRVAVPTVSSTSTTTNILEGFEATFTVNFTNFYVEQPVFTYGFELDSTSQLIPQYFPSGSAFITNWIINSDGNFGIASSYPYPLYKGAAIGVVLSCIPGTKMWCDYCFTGRGQTFSNVTSVDATVTQEAGGPTV